MSAAAISDAEFGLFQRLLADIAGISLSPAKRALVAGRLAPRLRQHGLPSFGAYFTLLGERGREAELQIALDLLTTNETRFFREPAHFEFLRRQLRARPAGRPLRLWSAACSSGEEPYSLAMLLADTVGPDGWDILASDLSTRVLEQASSGCYRIEAAGQIPPPYLRRYCRRGTGAHSGRLLIERALRQRVRFAQINLNETLPELGQFDLIFLRNVMIYFELDTKRAVIARLLPLLRPGGHLVIGHSETLNGIGAALRPVQPSVYRKEGA